MEQLAQGPVPRTDREEGLEVDSGRDDHDLLLARDLEPHEVIGRGMGHRDDAIGLPRELALEGREPLRHRRVEVAFEHMPVEGVHARQVLESAAGPARQRAGLRRVRVQDVRFESGELVAQERTCAQVAHERPAASESRDSHHVESASARFVEQVALAGLRGAHEDADMVTACSEQRIAGEHLPSRATEVQPREHSCDAHDGSLGCDGERFDVAVHRQSSVRW